MNIKNIPYDERKSNLKTFPSNWIENKCNFAGFTNRDIVLFRLRHGMSLDKAIRGLYESVREYRILSGIL